MIVPILLGVLTLAVLVLAFFASKFWHWAHVLVLVAFYFATVGYAMLAARSLDTRLRFQKQESQALIEIEKNQALIDALQRGSQDPSLINQLAAREVLAAQETDTLKGTIDLDHELQLVNRIRGRAWQDAAPTGPPDPQTGVIEVRFPVRTEEIEGVEGEEQVAAEEPVEGEAPAEPAGPPPPLGLEPNAIVYVFEQGPPEGRKGRAPSQYLGEFRVEAVDARTALLEPLDQLELDPVATQRLIDSRGPWVVYETMPADDRALFAGMEEERLRKLLPERVVEEYLRDGTPATPDDPEERLVAVDADGNVVPPDDAEEKGVAKRFRRRLRDYALELNNLEAERAALVAREQALTADIAKLEASLASAKELSTYREKERARWQADLAAVERDRKAVQRHEKALVAQVTNARKLLEATLQENAALASMRGGVLTPMDSGVLDVNAL